MPAPIESRPHAMAKAPSQKAMVSAAAPGLRANRMPAMNQATPPRRSSQRGLRDRLGERADELGDAASHQPDAQDPGEGDAGGDRLEDAEEAGEDAQDAGEDQPRLGPCTGAAEGQDQRRHPIDEGVGAPHHDQAEGCADRPEGSDQTEDEGDDARHDQGGGRAAGRCQHGGLLVNASGRVPGSRSSQGGA